MLQEKQNYYTTRDDKIIPVYCRCVESIMPRVKYTCSVYISTYVCMYDVNNGIVVAFR